MKKALLTISAACLAMSAMAFAPQQVEIPTQAMDMHSFSNLAEIQPLGSLTVGQPTTIHNSPARNYSVDDVIVSPEGTKKNVTMHGTGYYVFMGLFLTAFTDLDKPSHMVYGEDNDVYICDIIPMTNLGTYTKGTIEGNKVTIDLPQLLYYSDEYEEGYKLNILTLIEIPQIDEETGEPILDEEGNPAVSYTYVEPEEPTTLTFTIDENGVWTTEDISEEHMLGLALCSGRAWPGYGATDLSIAPFDDVPVEVPGNLLVANNYWSLIFDEYGWPLNYAQADDEMYLQGMCSFFPEVWLKASVEYGDTEASVKFPQNQYVGVYDNYYYIYTKCAKLDTATQEWSLMPDDYQYELIWNLEHNTMKAKDPDVYFVFNANPDRVFSLTKMQNMTLMHQNSFGGTPVNPYNLTFNDMMDSAGYSSFTFTVPAISTEGTLLLTDNLYYVVYVDGEEWTFDADEYLIPETITEVPWKLSEYHIFGYNGKDRLIDFFIEGIETIGVQSVYYCDGVETRSDIVSINLESKVETMSPDNEVAGVAYFDLMGCRVDNPTNGIYIKRIDYKDGTSVSAKQIVR